MKFLLILGILLFPLFGFSQVKSGYYLTYEQHELLRKDLKDYKNLIEKYDVLSKDFEKLKRDFTTIKLIHNKQTIEYENLKAQSLETYNLNVKINNLNEEIKTLNEANDALKKELTYKNKSLYMYKARYVREHKKNRGDRVIGNSILGMFIVGGLWTIYTSIETNYLK